MERAVTTPLSPPAKNPVATKIDISAPRVMKPPSISFVDLPAEVRNEVYESLFHKGDPAVQLLARNGAGYISMSDRLGLLATCRQLYEEVSSFLRCQGRINIVQSKTFLELMDVGRVRAQVFNCLFSSLVIRVTCDLDLGTTRTSAIPPIFHASTKLRKLSSRALYSKITAKTTASTNFRTLRQWSYNPFTCNGDRRLGIDRMNLIIYFPPGNENEIQGSCFQAAHLIWATDKLPTELRLCTCSIDEDTEQMHEIMSLTFFRERLFLFVHELISAYPWSDMDPCPAIWVDRDLKIIRADINVEEEEEAAECVQNSQCNLPWLDIDRTISIAALIHSYRDLVEPRPNYEYGRTTGNTANDPDTQETLLGFAIRLAELLCNYYQCY